MMQERKSKKARRYGGSGETAANENLTAEADVVDISGALQLINEALQETAPKQKKIVPEEVQQPKLQITQMQSGQSARTNNGCTCFRRR